MAPELDLDEIRGLLAQPHGFHIRLAAGRLLAEVERLTRLLGPVEVPSVDAYENVVQALADERAEVVQHCNRVRDLSALLAEILAYFPTGPTDPGWEVRSSPLQAETLVRWRSHLAGAP